MSNKWLVYVNLRFAVVLKLVINSLFLSTKQTKIKTL